MAQSTARTGPSGLVKPTSSPTTPPPSLALNGDLEAAFHQIRQIAARPAPGPFPESLRFSIETAKGLADAAPQLYETSTVHVGSDRRSKRRSVSAASR